MWSLNACCVVTSSLASYTGRGRAQQYQNNQGTSSNVFGVLGEPQNQQPAVDPLAALFGPMAAGAPSMAGPQQPQQQGMMAGNPWGAMAASIVGMNNSSGGGINAMGFPTGNTAAGMMPGAMMGGMPTQSMAGGMGMMGMGGPPGVSFPSGNGAAPPGWNGTQTAGALGAMNTPPQQPGMAAGAYAPQGMPTMATVVSPRSVVTATAAPTDLPNPVETYLRMLLAQPPYVLFFKPSHCNLLCVRLWVIELIFVADHLVRWIAG